MLLFGISALVLNVGESTSVLICWSRRIDAWSLSPAKSYFLTLWKEVGIFKLLKEAGIFKLCTSALYKVLGSSMHHEPCVSMIFSPKNIGAPLL